MNTTEKVEVLIDVVRCLIKNHNSEAAIVMRKLDSPVDDKAMNDAIGNLISVLRLNSMDGVEQEANIIRNLFKRAMKGETNA